MPWRRQALRQQFALPPDGHRARASSEAAQRATLSPRLRKRAAEPWLLATNLENESAQSIVRIYAQRMQTERLTAPALTGVCLRRIVGRRCSGARLGEVTSRQLTTPTHAVGVYGGQPRRQKSPSQPNSAAERLQASQSYAPEQSSSFAQDHSTPIGEPQRLAASAARFVLRRLWLARR